MPTFSSPKVGVSVVSHYTWPKEGVTLFTACCIGSVSIWMASGCAQVQLAVATPTQNPCVMLSGQQTGGVPCWEDQRGKLTSSSWAEWGMKQKCSPKAADKEQINSVERSGLLLWGLPAAPWGQQPPNWERDGGEKASWAWLRYWGKKGSGRSKGSGCKSVSEMMDRASWEDS